MLFRASSVRKIDKDLVVEWLKTIDFTAVRNPLAYLSKAFPNQFEKGFEIIESFNSIPSTYVYHAGTKLDSEGKLVTAGGRVLTVVGIAETLQKARDLAYKRVESISFKNAFYRKDIGDKSLKGVIK